MANPTRARLGGPTAEAKLDTPLSRSGSPGAGEGPPATSSSSADFSETSLDLDAALTLR